MKHPVSCVGRGGMWVIDIDLSWVAEAVEG